MIKSLFKLTMKVMFALGIIVAALSLLRIWEENSNDYIEIYNDDSEGELYE